MKWTLSLVVREKTSLRGAHYRAQPSIFQWLVRLLSSWPLPRMISRSRSKMLHQETGVYSNQDTWTERWFLRKRTSSRFAHSRDDTGGSVHNEEARKKAQVIATPIRIASTLPSSGKVVILQRK
ncbi:hypothetical protein KCU93_g275, partial [Aureobasidium melanogenum]